MKKARRKRYVGGRRNDGIVVSDDLGKMGLRVQSTGLGCRVLCFEEWDGKIALIV